MLLTGFDSKYLNTLYVDKNLKQHSLIQAFSRTNRVLNPTKPFGNVLNFCLPKKTVDEAIALFSGEDSSRAKEIWLVEPAPEIIKKMDKTVSELEDFMKSQGLPCTAKEVNNLKGDAARANFINHFKEVQRLKIQLDQYTNLNDEQRSEIEMRMPTDQLRAFRSMYLDIAQRFKNSQNKGEDESHPEVQQLDSELVLFSSVVIDYDYIMSLIADYTQPTAKHKTTREQVISLLSSSANLIEERDDTVAYIDSLKPNVGLSVGEVYEGYEAFKEEKYASKLAAMAEKHGLASDVLQKFVDDIMSRMIFDSEQLTDLMAVLNLSWKLRMEKKLELMEDLVPLLKRLAQGREISGLAVYG